MKNHLLLHCLKYLAVCSWHGGGIAVMFRDLYLHIKTINKTKECYYKNKDSGGYLGGEARFIIMKEMCLAEFW